MQFVDTVIAVYNDLHAGSPVAPFPPRQWEMPEGNYLPTRLQIELYNHLKEASEEIGRRRKGKRLIIIKLGDMVEGLHHNSKQVSSTRRAVHEAISLELMDRIDEWTGFTDGDLEFFVAGTESHVEESEERIARDRDAQAYIPPTESGRDGVYVFPVLNITINGIPCFFAHHGPATGEGANKGNGLRGRIKNMYLEYLEIGKVPPRLVVFADKHRKHYERVWRSDKVMIDAIISPAYQVKTEFVYKIRPEALSNVGCTCIEIKSNGDILGLENPFLTLNIEQDKMVFA